MSSHRPVRLAILGLGFMGTTHLRALSAVRGVELAAVFCNNEKKLAGDLSSVRGNFGGAGEKLDFSGITQYREIEAVLADPKIDAVDICLPTYLHDTVAIGALRAGKHVLVEKPMALDAFSVDRMLSAITRYKRVLMTAHVLRFWPAYKVLRDEIRRPEMGAMRFATFRRRCAAPSWSAWLQDPTQSGGGAFDLLIHDIDMCLHLFGKPEAVTAAGYSDAAAGIDCLDAQLFYPQGGVAAVTGGWHHQGAYPFSMEYTVSLDGGTVEFSSAGRAPTLYSSGKPEEPLDVMERDAYAAEIEYFGECCHAGQEPELCRPRDSADAVKLMALVLEARNRGGRKMACRI